MSQATDAPAGTPRLLLLRRALAGAAALAAVYEYHRIADGERVPALWLPTLLLGATVILVHARPLGAQLLARAVFWANLVLGVLLTVSSGGADARLGVMLALTCGPSLLLLGSRGIDDSPGAGSFAPVALRGWLLAAMCMALADAQSFLLFGWLGVHKLESAALSWTLVGLGAALLVTVWGLFGLRAWGVLLSLVVNLAIAALLLSHASGDFFPIALRLGFAAAAIAQVLIALRIIAAFRLGAAPSPRALPRRTVHLSGLAVAALTLIAVAACVMR